MFWLSTPGDDPKEETLLSVVHLCPCTTHHPGPLCRSVYRKQGGQGNPSPLSPRQWAHEMEEELQRKEKGSRELYSEANNPGDSFCGICPCQSPVLAFVGTCQADRTSPSLCQSCDLRPKPPGWDLCWPGSGPGSGPINSGAQRRTLLWEVFGRKEELSIASPEVVFFFFFFNYGKNT